MDKPEKWTQRMYARDSKGHVVEVRSPYATCFCLSGAIQKTHNVAYFDFKHLDTSEYKKLSQYLKSKYELGVTAFNDSPDTTYELVISILKELDI